MSGLKTKVSMGYFGRVILEFVAGVDRDVMGGERRERCQLYAGTGRRGP